MRCLKDVPLGNGNWLAELPGGGRHVLRRYHAGATAEDLRYEHVVLRHLARAGWVVPEPAGEPVQYSGLWYCLTRFVPDGPAGQRRAGQRRRRGRDLGRLHLALRGLGELAGQRPGWRAAHQGIPLRSGVSSGISWPSCAAALAEVSPRLGAWALAAAHDAEAALAAVGAADLPLQVVHGDFTAWNVYYRRDRLAGVIDFGLAHLDSRPYELASARTCRAPEVIGGYRDEVARHGWPLSGLESAAIGPLRRAFRLDLAAWHVSHARAVGDYDLAAIERQLARTGTPQP